MKTHKLRKNQMLEIHILDPAGNVQKCMGMKKPGGKLLIDNPFYVKQVKRIEKRWDT